MPNDDSCRPSSLLSGVGIGPGNEKRLQREAQPCKPNTHSGHSALVRACCYRCVDIGREDGYQRSHQGPGGKALSPGHKQEHSQRTLYNTANKDNLKVIRQNGRNQSHIDVAPREVEHPTHDENTREQPLCNMSYEFHYCACVLQVSGRGVHNRRNVPLEESLFELVNFECSRFAHSMQRPCPQTAGNRTSP